MIDKPINNHYYKQRLDIKAKNNCFIVGISVGFNRERIKTMKKRYLVLAAAVVLSLAGCQSNQADSTSTSESMTAKADEVVSSAESSDSVQTETSTAETPEAETSSEAAQGITAGVWRTLDAYYFFDGDGKSAASIDFENGNKNEFEYELEEDNSVVMKNVTTGDSSNGVLNINGEEDITFVWEDGTSQSMKYVTDMTIDEFTFYTDEELIEAVKKYYTENVGDPVPDTFSVVHNEDGFASVLLYVKEYSTSFDMYRLNRRSLTGTNSVGDAADLRNYAPNN